MINKFLNTLFPEPCPVCSGRATDHLTAPICTECWQNIVPCSLPTCQRCGKPLMSEFSLTCGNCLNSEPAFKYAKSFGIYDGVLRKAINLFKYYGVKRLSKPLSDIIMKMELPRVEVLIPVPLFKTRLKQREFNQSALIARQLSKYLNLDLLINCLVKVKDTTPQVGLTSRERFKNIKNAFKVSRKNLIKDKDIMLIDDVVTTGSTIRECSKVLKNAGAADIHVISLAHGISE